MGTIVGFFLLFAVLGTEPNAVPLLWTYRMNSLEDCKQVEQLLTEAVVNDSRTADIKSQCISIPFNINGVKHS